ncbi:MAG: hypothetical protein IJY39_01515 [Clostridia bacterium]|nr:hypothetical protein [Clostridia bacterium]
MKAEIRKLLGTLRLFVNGEILPPDAYITYFTDKNRYGDFADVGYKLYSLPLFFSSKTLNENSQAPCFGHPIFDGDEPDWDALDTDFHKVLEACPDALIFPRVNVSLSEKWERENPDELCDEGMVELHRPCFSSDKWAEETMRLYSLAIEHIEGSDYADRVIGYQFAAGNTEEWFPHDMKGSIGKRSREKFAEYCKEQGIEGTAEDMYAFLSDIVAKRICDLAALTKKKAGRDKLVGTFYGYTFECPSRTTCHHSLDKVLECPDVDFICSPVSYGKNRELGRDHGCMLPCDSLREHGKLYFAENDTRTHLTVVPYPDLPYFQAPVFKPKRFDDTVEMLKLHFARALVHGYAHWWFDMWGGWYADETYMAEMKEFLEMSKAAVHKPMGSLSQVAVFIDEKAYKFSSGGGLAYNIRESLGKIGAPYDCYLASDYERVKERYSAVILIDPYRTPLAQSIVTDTEKRGVGLFVITPQNAAVTPEVLRRFCRENGVHIYTDRDAVVYANESYLFVHAEGDEMPEITLPDGSSATPLFTSEATSIKHPSCVSMLWEII